MIINIKCGFWDFLDAIPTPLQWNTFPPEKTNFPLRRVDLPPKEIIYIDQEGHYTTSQRGMNGKITTVRFYSPDPTKQIVFYLNNVFIFCRFSNTYEWIRWFDGWNTSDHVILPYIHDHPFDYDGRFSENLCEMGRPFYSKLLKYTSAQNFAEVSTHFITEHHLGIGFTIYFKDNPEPCHALLIDSLDSNRKCPYFKSFTLQNYGSKPMNCSLFIIKHFISDFEASLKFQTFQVGHPNSIKQIKNDKKPITCSRKGDHLYINGNVRPEPDSTKEIDFCNEHYPELNRGFPITCTNVTIRLVSSGRYQNQVVFSYLPPEPEEICRWEDEVKTNTPRIYQTLNCLESY